jgi:transcriptional regulator NrdR family protein
MLCPSCGGKTHVPRSNISDATHIVRQRVCKRCGHSEISVEVYLSSMQDGLEWLTKEKLSDIK